MESALEPPFGTVCAAIHLGEGRYPDPSRFEGRRTDVEEGPDWVSAEVCGGDCAVGTSFLLHLLSILPLQNPSSCSPTLSRPTRICAILDFSRIGPCKEGFSTYHGTVAIRGSNPILCESMSLKTASPQTDDRFEFTHTRGCILCALLVSWMEETSKPWHQPDTSSNDESTCYR